MRNQSSLLQSLDKLAFVLGGIFVFLFPLLYVTATSEFVSYPKFVFVHIIAVLMLFIWGIRTAVQGRIATVKTPFDSAFFFIAIAFVISTWSSVSPYTSLFGEYNVWHWTFSELLSFLIIGYVLVTVVTSVESIGRLVFTFLTSTTIVALLGLATYLNLFDSLGQGTGYLQILATDGFSLAGNAHSFIYLLTVALLFELFFLIAFARENNSPLFPFLPFPQKVLAILSTVKIAIFGIAILAWLGSVIPVLPQRVDLPANLDWSESWRVASSAIRDYPIFGTGPSTYDIAYRGYRSAAINLTDNWNVAFNRSGSEYLTWLTTVGVVGFGALLFFVVKLIFHIKTRMYSREGDQQRMQYEDPQITLLQKPVALGLIVTLISWLFISTTVTIIGVFFVLLFVWLMLDKVSQEPTVHDVHIQLGNIASLTSNTVGVKNNVTNVTGESSILSYLVALLLVIIAGFTGYYVIQDARSNIVFARSLKEIAANGSIVEVYDSQRIAVRLNPYRDAYRRSYANTNIATAQLIASERGESLTDTERQEVLSLVQQSIREARVITERLNRFKAVNWQARGRVYQSLLGVARGADAWSLQAYQQAVVLAPNDPQLRVDLGGMYLALATTTPQEGQVGDAPGDEVPDAPDTKTTNLVRAEAALVDAIRLKPDFANAHFNLALVYREAERYDLAKQELEQTLRLLDENDAGYTQAQEILEQVIDKLPVGTEANTTSDTSPTPTPTASPIPTLTETPTVTPTVIPTAAATPTATPSVTSAN